jgi:hypothetical protein
MDNEYVMRFAIDGDASKRLLCEIIVRDVIRRSTRSAVPVPRFVATERWGTHQHLSFTLDEKLHGSAEMADITTRTERDLVILFDSLKSCVCVCG